MKLTDAWPSRSETTFGLTPANPDARVISTKSVELPPALVGTALDPAFSGEIPTKAEIDAAMKAIKAARPIKIARFRC